MLTLGNALNGLSFRGNARGFQLEALLKVHADNLLEQQALSGLVLDERNQDSQNWRRLSDFAALCSQTPFAV